MKPSIFTLPLLAILAACSTTPSSPELTGGDTPGNLATPKVSPLGKQISPAPPPDDKFGGRQSAAMIEEILSQEEPNTITVLFRDEFKVRVKTGAGAVRDSRNGGLVSLIGPSNALTALNTLMAEYTFLAITAVFAADTTPEEEREEKETSIERKTGEDFPNDGSWATLRLANYTDDRARRLLIALQGLEIVRSAEVNSTPAFDSPEPAVSPLTSMPAPSAPLPSPSRRPMKEETRTALAVTSVPFTYIAMDDWDNYSIEGNSRFVVLEQLADIGKVMREPRNLPHSPARRLQSVDFSRERAIVVCDRAYPCVESLEIVAVEETANSLVVHSVTWDPLGGGCFTAVSQPISIVTIPRGDKPITFKPIIFEDAVHRPSSRPLPNPN